MNSLSFYVSYFATLFANFSPSDKHRINEVYLDLMIFSWIVTFLFETMLFHNLSYILHEKCIISLVVVCTRTIRYSKGLFTSSESENESEKDQTANTKEDQRIKDKHQKEEIRLRFRPV